MNPNSSTEETVKELFGKMFLGAMDSKENVFRELVRILQEQQRIEEGLDKIIRTIDNGAEVNPAKTFRILSRSLKAQANAIRQLSTAILVYVAGDGFDGDCAKVANKFGYGQEALKKLFEAKLWG